MSVRTTYQIKKTKFLLWKDHASPALKIGLLGSVAIAALGCILALIFA
ncbi:MAG: hypothetical protein Kow0099_24460 [Candidatus Abyssubacteria bacterium]